MNQRGRGDVFLVRSDTAPSAEGALTVPDADVSALRLGARLLLFELRGEGDAGRGYVTGWGEVERLSSAEGTTTIQLRAYNPLKRRVPFTDLRADPRRDRAAAIQEVSPEVFNTVLSKARR